MMKKLESLKSDKFGLFEQDKLNNPLAISGGQVSNTSWYTVNTEGTVTGSGKDRWYTGLDDNGQTPPEKHWNTWGDMVDVPPADGGPGYDPTMGEQIYSLD